MDDLRSSTPSGTDAEEIKLGLASVLIYIFIATIYIVGFLIALWQMRRNARDIWTEIRVDLKDTQAELKAVRTSLDTMGELLGSIVLFLYPGEGEERSLLDMVIGRHMNNMLKDVPVVGDIAQVVDEVISEKTAEMSIPEGGNPLAAIAQRYSTAKGRRQKEALGIEALGLLFGGGLEEGIPDK